MAKFAKVSVQHIYYREPLYRERFRMCAFIAVMGEGALQRLEGEMSGSEAVNHDVVCALAVQHDLALGRAAHHATYVYI